MEIIPATSTIIKPTKASTSKPPRTTGRLSTPIFPNIKLISDLTPGGILAGILAFGGVAHILYNIRKQIEDSVFSFFNMNNIFLTIAYTVGAFFTYNHTKAPKNLFETDLINNEVKDFAKNTKSTLKENKSFKRILEKEFIENINDSMNGIIREASYLLKAELEKRGHDNYPSSYSSYEQNPKIPFLTQLYRDIFSDESGPLKEAPERLEAYIKENGKAGLLDLFGNLHRDIESSIMQTLIGSGSKGGTAKEHINLIRNEINQILTPNGLALLPVKYNLANGTIDLHFVFIKNGYPKGDTSPNPKLHTGGMSVSLTPAYFLYFAEKLTMYTNAIKGNEMVQQILSKEKDISKINGEDLENLNKVILSNMGLFIMELYKSMNGTGLVYDPESGGFTPTQLGPIDNILNSIPRIELAALIQAIGLSGGTVLLSGLIDSTSGLPRNRREEEGEFSFANKDGTGKSTGTISYDELNGANNSGVSSKSREETLRQRRELDHRNGLLNDVLSSSKGLGIVLREGEHSRLTELKLSLIALQLKFLNNRSILEEKIKILRINAFYEKHKSEIDAEQNKIIEEIGKRKNEVTTDVEIEREINLRLEKYKQTLFEDKFETESKQLTINPNNINSIELSEEKKSEFKEEYSNMAHDLSQAVSELLPENNYLDDEQQLKFKEADTIATKYGIRDFLLLALDGSLTGKDGEEAVIKVDGDNISINFTNKDGTVEKRILRNDNDLFYELARSTYGKTTTQAVTCLEKLFRVLDKDHAKVLREAARKLKVKVDCLSGEAKRKKIQSYNNPAEKRVVDKNPVKA